MAKRSFVELQGKDDLKRAFANLSASMKTEIKDVNRITAQEIVREAKARVRVRSGETRSKIKATYTDGGLGATVGTSWYKARFIEFGYRLMHIVGTRRGAKGRWAKQQVKRFAQVGTVPARPFLFPAFEIVRPKYLERLRSAIYGATRFAGGN